MKYASILHRIAGILAVIAFLGTGLYMHRNRPAPSLGTHLLRMLYRSAHVYLLLSGLINIALGSYFIPSRSEGMRRLQGVGSVLIILSPVIILAGFLYEVAQQRLDRPMIVSAVVSLFAGTLLHLLASSSPSQTRG